MCYSKCFGVMFYEKIQKKYWWIGLRSKKDDVFVPFQTTI